MSFDDSEKLRSEMFGEDSGLPRAEHEATDRRLAERLDASETEKVMRRAMELEEGSSDATDTFSPEDLERIAAEIGINPEFIRQAIAEVRSSHGDRSRIDTFLLPDPLHAKTTMTGLTREQLDGLIQRWMSEYEGLIPVGQVSSGLEWEMDQNALVRLRTAMTSGANRMSRTVPGPIQHRVASVNDAEHVVTFSADDRQPLLLAKAGSALGAVVAVALVGPGIADGSYEAVFIAAPVASGGIVAASVLGARVWAANMKKALNKSLVGLASQKVPASKWRRKSARKANSRRKRQQDRPES